MSESKVCTKCGEEKLLEEFSPEKRVKDGRTARCKECRHKYYQDNREAALQKMKIYRDENPELVKKRKAGYYNKVKDEAWFKESRAKYREDNREEARVWHKEYQADNVDMLRARKRKTVAQPSDSEVMFGRLLPIDSPEMVDGVITVSCRKCGKRFAPTKAQVYHRCRCIENPQTPGSESNFYCADACKNPCELFRFHSISGVDPRSKLYVPKTEQEEAGACQTDHLKQLQRDEFGYNYCEACGQEVDIVDLHHTLEIAKHGTDAINSAGHILLCKECHKKLTRVC